VAHYRCSTCGLAFAADEARCPKCLRKTTVQETAAPAPARRERTAAEKHVLANFVLQLGLVVLHLLTTASVVINLVLSVLALSGELPAELRYPSPPPGPGRVAHFSTFACIGLFSVLGIGWVPINAWGLHKRKRWARTSTLVYWAASFITCCCAPLGVYGVYSLLRADVRALFEREGT
jgi:hypothetical protein